MSVSYRTHVESSTEDFTEVNPFTFSAVDIGDPSSGRVVVVSVGVVWSADAGADYQPVSVAIGGVEAVKAGTGAENVTVIPISTSLWSARVPSGSTGDIVITVINETPGLGMLYSISVWALADVSNSVSDTASDSDPDGTVSNIDADVANGSVAIGSVVTFNLSALATVAWTGLTENNDFDLFTVVTFSGASFPATSTETPRTITATSSIETARVAVSGVWPAGGNQDGGAVIVGVGTLAVNAAHTPAGAALLAGTGTLAASTRVITQASALLAGTGTLSVNAAHTPTGAARFTGAGALAADGMVAKFGAALLPGLGTLSASISHTPAGAALLAGLGGLQALGSHTPAGAARLPGIGAIAIDAVHTPQAAALLAGTGALLANAIVHQSENSSAFLDGVGALEVTTIQMFMGEASLDGDGTLVVGASRLQDVEALLAGEGTLAVDVTLVEIGHPFYAITRII